MGTQGPGRKRHPNREKLSAEDQALNQIAREAEARLAAKRAARAEAREIRMKELERQQKEVEERSEKDFVEKSGRPLSSLSAATLASLGGTSSRRGSGDTSISVDTEASIREIKDSLAEVEEKYKRSMVTNAQLDNEKSSLQYQVDTLRDVLLELEEELAESRRQYDEKNKECERQKHDQSVLRFQLAEMKDALEQREALLAKNGIALDSGVTPNGDSSLEPHVNADGPPSPPIRSTSMGKSDTNVEKKETMSVLGKCSPSATEQDCQNVFQEAPVETPLHSEGATEKDTEKDINGNTGGEVKPAVDGNCLQSETNVDQPVLVPTNETEKVNVGKEMKAEDDHKSVEEEVFEHSLSEGNGDANRKDVSPAESEVFQDALEFVAQTPNEVSGLNQEVSCCVSVDHKSDQVEDLHRKDEQCMEQHLMDENSNHPEESVKVLDSEAHDTNEIPESLSNNEKSDSIMSPDCDHSVNYGLQESSKNDSEEKTECDTARDLENMKSSGDEYPKDETGFQPLEEDLDQKENEEETGFETTEQLSIPVEKFIEDGRQDTDQNREDIDQNKASPAPENLSENTILTHMEAPLTDSENIKILDHSEPESEPCFINENKNISKDGDRNLEQQEPCSDSCTNAKSLNPSAETSQENDNPQCGDLDVAKIMQEEEKNKFVGEKPQELDANSETTKDSVPCETLSSEGESTQEGDETDEEEDGSTRSEKYTGESEMPAGSTGGGPSLEDIRMEDSLDTSTKKGKGKNKEDCSLS